MGRCETIIQGSRAFFNKTVASRPRSTANTWKHNRINWR